LKRPIRSYVLRQGRVTPAQRRALDALFPRYGIEFKSEFLDPAAVFGRKASLVLEIGSGMGEGTVEIARAHPETDFIAIEVHGPGVGSLLNRIEAEKLTNLRVLRHDAVEVLEHMIPDAALAGIHLFFPDPWPKKRHHKRRLVQPAFAALAARKLAPGGYLHSATDWPDYAAHMLAILSAEPLLQNTAEDYAPRTATRPQTKFERRGVKLGHPLFDLLFLRRTVVPR
jgi:tRNA (guanine-N7-)-methyltransferase